MNTGSWGSKERSSNFLNHPKKLQFSLCSLHLQKVWHNHSFKRFIHNSIPELEEYQKRQLLEKWFIAATVAGGRGSTGPLNPSSKGKVEKPCLVASHQQQGSSDPQNKVKIGERESGKSAYHCSISTSMGSVVEALECTLSFTQIPLFFVRSVTKALNLKQKLQSPLIRLFVLLSPGQH